MVSEQLNAIPPVRRRRMALALAPVGGVLLLAGMLAFSLPGLGWKLLSLPVGLLGLVLLGVAWGLWRSVGLAEAALAEQRLDEVLTAAAVAAGASCAPAASGDGDRAPADAVCGSTGLTCSSGSATGCGASCLTRTR